MEKRAEAEGSEEITLGKARSVLAQAATGYLSLNSGFKDACRLALRLMPKEHESSRTPATIMVCSDCGTVISVTNSGAMFDIYDCSWECPG
ncbi:hypothetical protein LCGC14_3038110, partial [marine sediment metagenome]